MPPLDTSGSATSFFEFWPLWLMYTPVALQWLRFSLRYRSLSLPLIANPTIPNGGMVGFSKSAFLGQAGAAARRWILPWQTHTVTEAPFAEQVDDILARLAGGGLGLPIVGKPDMGCRGAGVKLLQTRADLHGYLAAYPVGSTLMLQQLAPWEPEAGVFYVRYPNEAKGRIVSMALKYTPYVVGDGRSSLHELLMADPRASKIMHLYEARHADKFDQVLARGEPFRLVFAASHCRGAVFRDGRQYISAALHRRLDEILSAIPDFYYGRLDIKFKSIEGLMAGKDLAIVEINGASSESLHIWDRKAGLMDAWSALLGQYRTLFEIGHLNRQRGHRPPGIGSLLKAWRAERRLLSYYPTTD